MRVLNSDSRRGFTQTVSNHESTLAWNEHNQVDPHYVADQDMANRIMQVLQMHYPGHPWFVEVSHHNKVGIAKIKMPGFTSWSYVLLLSDLKNDPALKAVVRAGGEFLERYRLPRTGIDFASYVNAMHQHGGIFRQKLAPPE